MSEVEIEIIKEFINLEEIHSSKSNPRTYLSVYQGAVEELLKNYMKQQKEIEELSKLHYDLGSNFIDLDSKCKQQQKEIEEKTTIIMAGAEKVKGLEKEIEELNVENAQLINQRTDGYWENDRLKKETERLNQEIRNWTEKEHNLTQALLSKRTNSISKDKIKEILGIEEDMTEEQILSYIDILVSENNRLEDIEDRKVQVAVDNIEKKIKIKQLKLILELN